MRSRVLIVPLLLFASAVAAQPQADGAALADAVNKLLQGRFDNREQVAHTQPDAARSIPHVSVAIEPASEKDFTLWRVHVEIDPQSIFEQTWAMQTRIEHDGSGALIPYYQLKQESSPDAASFDPHGWLSLEACALRGTFAAGHVEAIAEGEPCVAVSMNVGARRALLPVAVTRGGNSLHLYLNLHGVRTHIDARQEK